jgi:hypothetical protein
MASRHTSVMKGGLVFAATPNPMRIAAHPMNVAASTSQEPFRLSVPGWILLALIAVAVGASFQVAISEMLHTWSTREEYSYGPLIPVLAAFLVWQRKDRLASGDRTGAWGGVALIAAGIALLVVGRVATLVILEQVALLLVI